MSRDEAAERGFTRSSHSAEHGFESRSHSAEHGFESRRHSAEHGFESRRRSAEHGFTLIEIMVALAVFSLAALALIRLEGATIRSTALLQSTLLAQIVARNVAVEAVSDVQPPTRGRVSGAEQNGGQAWRWVRDVRAIGDGDVMRVDVAVADRDGTVLGRATMIRPPAQLASVRQ